MAAGGAWEICGQQEGGRLAGADEFRGAGGVLKGVAVTANRRQVVSHALWPLVVREALAITGPRVC